jgi:hypothetical protein
MLFVADKAESAAMTAVKTFAVQAMTDGLFVSI